MSGFRRSFLFAAWLISSTGFVGNTESAELALPVLDPDRHPHEPRGGFNPAHRMRIIPDQGRLVYFETDLMVPGSAFAPLLQRIYTAPQAGSRRGPGNFGAGWRTIYDRRIRTTGSEEALLIDEYGRTFRFSRKGAREFEALEGTPRRLTTSSGGWVLQESNGLVWEFGKSGWCVGVGDRRDNRLDIERDTRRPAIVKAVRDTYGSSLTFESNNDRLVTRVECSDGRTVDYEYRGDLLAAVRPNTKPGVRYAYDAGGRLSAVTFPGGLTMKTRFDGKEGYLREVAAAGMSRRYSFRTKPGGSEIQSIERTDGLGRNVRWQFQDRGLEIVDETGATLQVEHDNRNRPVRLAIEGAGIWRWRHDPSGRIVEAAGPTNESLRMAYKETQLRPAFVEHPDGLTLRFSYDAQQRLTSVSRGNLPPWRFEYDDSGRLVGFENYLHVRYELKYDEKGRIAAVSDSPGPDYRVTRDKFGRISAVGRTGGPVIRFERDADGRVSAADDGVESVRFEYTVSGNLALVSSSRGYTRRFYYAPSGLVSIVQYPEDGILRFVYDSEHCCIGIRRANGSGVSLARGSGNRIEILESGDDRWRAIYDRRGRPRTFWKVGQERVRMDTDPTGRFRESRSGSRPFLAATYAGNSTIEQLETPQQRLRFGFDPGGRLQSIAERNSGRRSAWEYDENNRLIRHGKPGWTEQYGYNPDGTLEDLKISEPAPVSYRFEYDDHRRLLGIRYPNGVHTRFEYDTRSRLSRVRTRNREGKTLIVMDADHATSSRLVRATGLGTDRFEYRYDAHPDLIEIAWPTGRRDTFRRDAVGNLVVLNENGRREVLQYGPDGRPTAVGQRRYVYRPAGRVSQPPDPSTVILGLDDWNRVAELRTGDVSARYAYLPDGRLIRREVGGSTFAYGWDGQRLRSIRDAKGRLLVAFHYEPQFGLPLAIVVRGRVYYCHPDVFGLPYWLTDENGNTVPAPADFPVEVGRPTAPALRPTWTGLPPAVRLPEEDLLLVRGRLCDPRSGNYLAPHLKYFLAGRNAYVSRTIARPLEPVVAWRELSHIIRWIEDIETPRLEKGQNRAGRSTIPLHRLAALIRAPETLESDLLREAFDHDLEVERWLAHSNEGWAKSLLAGLPMSALEPPRSPAGAYVDFSPLGPIPYDWSNDLERLVPGATIRPPR